MPASLVRASALLIGELSFLILVADRINEWCIKLAATAVVLWSNAMLIDNTICSLVCDIMSKSEWYLMQSAQYTLLVMASVYDSAIWDVGITEWKTILRLANDHTFKWN